MMALVLPGLYLSKELSFTIVVAWRLRFLRYAMHFFVWTVSACYYYGTLWITLFGQY